MADAIDGDAGGAAAAAVGAEDVVVETDINANVETPDAPTAKIEEHSANDATTPEDAAANADLDHEQDGETKEPTYPPSKELTLEDVYNPRNLTWDELEMLLYEWEEEATSVSEYLDMRVIHKLRTGEHDDDWEEEEEEEEEKPKGGGWLSRLKDTAKHEDDGSKTKVEFKKGPTKYLNLTDDAAHVVEFYAPW